MAFRHGIFTSEDPTPLVPPVSVDSAMPVAFVTAPVHLSRNPYSVTHEPKLCFNIREATSAFGFHQKPEIWNNYTACEVIFSQFSLYAVSPIVIINVLDPHIHNETVLDYQLRLVGKSGIIPVDGVLIDTITVQDTNGTNYESGEHFTLAFNRDGFVVLHAKEDVGIGEGETLIISFIKLAPEKVDIWDFIGGYDAQTRRKFGMELVNSIYPLFRRVPGLLLAPGYSGDPTLAAVMETRAANINGHFSCPALVDIPTMIESDKPDDKGNLKLEHLPFTNIPAFKNKNNFVFPGQILCYPKVRLGELIFNYSTQLAGLIGRTDHENSDTPYVSPSNQNLNINGLCYADGEEIVMGNQEAAFLSGNGIVTALNFSKGWTAWGNRTAAFPGNTDPKDAFIPIRRMFFWVGNTIVLTYWRKVDFPLVPRVIQTVKNSIEEWLDELNARQFILGGTIEMLPDDNSIVSLSDGSVTFRVKISPPPPLEEAEFILQYDPQHLMTLFGG